MSFILNLITNVGLTFEHCFYKDANICHGNHCMLCRWNKKKCTKMLKHVYMNPSVLELTSADSISKKGLFIGIDYLSNNKTKRLAQPVYRARRFSSFMRTSFHVHQNRTLTDDHQSCLPTRQNILLNLKWLINDNKRGDIIFLYFSGHIKGNYLLPSDFETGGLIYDQDIYNMFSKNIEKGITAIIVFDVPQCTHNILLSHFYIAKQNHILCRSTEHFIKSGLIYISSTIGKKGKANLSHGILSKYMIKVLKKRELRISLADLLIDLTNDKHVISHHLTPFVTTSDCINIQTFYFAISNIV